MPRFTLDSAPIPTRRFKLPEGERSTAPAPLPELGKPFKLHEWGPGLATETRKRPVAAHTPKRTPSRPAEAQMGAGGLVTVSAPVGPRKGRTVLDFVAATDAEMDGFMGTIRLQIDADSVDLGRLSGGVMALCVDHNTSALMGRVTEATVYPGRLDMVAEVGDTPTATEAMAEIDDLMRAGFSPGFLIHETEVIDADHPDYDEDQMFQIEVTRWEPYEISSTAIPRNPNARLRGVASMNSNAIMDAPEILNRDDMIGLSLAAGRKVLASGKGTDAQRSKLTEFFKLYDAGVERGLTRDVAATAAKSVAGI